jgi:hypothetical protein
VAAIAGLVLVLVVGAAGWSVFREHGSQSATARVKATEEARAAELAAAAETKSLVATKGAAEAKTHSEPKITSETKAAAAAKVEAGAKATSVTKAMSETKAAAAAKVAAESPLDSLVGTWKNPRPGGESLKVVIRKNQAGELVVQGDDSASSYRLTCRPKSGGVSCAGSGTMRADGEAFIYRNNIKLVGDKLIESWRVNPPSSPDGPPTNSGNDELVR